MQLNHTTEKGSPVTRIILTSSEREDLVILLRDIRAAINLKKLKVSQPDATNHKFNTTNWLTLDQDIPLGLELQVGPIGHHVDGAFLRNSLLPTHTPRYKFCCQIDPSLQQIKQLNKAIRKLNRLTGTTFNEYQVDMSAPVLSNSDVAARMDSRRDAIRDWVIDYLETFRNLIQPNSNGEVLLDKDKFIKHMVGTGSSPGDVKLEQQLTKLLSPESVKVDRDGDFEFYD